MPLKGDEETLVGGTLKCMCFCTSYTQREKNSHSNSKRGDLWEARTFWLVLTTSKASLEAKTWF